MMYDWNGYGYDVWSWLFMLLMMAAFFVGLIFLIRYLGGEWRRSRGREDPMETLKSRYARGEIDKKEFEEKKKDLNS